MGVLRGSGWFSVDGVFASPFFLANPIETETLGTEYAGYPGFLLVNGRKQ